MINTNLEIQQVPIGTLIPYARNPRHNEQAIGKVAASIAEFGFKQPIVIGPDNVIIAGHTRYAAAQKLGLATVPVVIAADLTPNQIKAYRIADNRVADEATWDNELLALEFLDLEQAEYDMSLMGFETFEIESIMNFEAEADSDTEPDPGPPPETMDEVPVLPKTPVSKAGDVWCLGRHHLICGDSTDPLVVAQLMGGVQAHLCFTSPPYDNQRDYTSGGIDWQKLMQGVFASIPMRADGQVLVNLGLIHKEGEFQPYWDAWLGWMRSQGWKRFAWYVWHQGDGMPGDHNGRLAPAHEFIFHFNRQARQPNKIVPCKSAGEVLHKPRKDGSASGSQRAKDGQVKGWTQDGAPVQDFKVPDSVISIMRHKGGIGKDISHPAVFPVALPEFILRAYTTLDDLVFEPFSGSGTTILAGQRIGRIVRAVEFAPEYVDVAIKRFKQNYPDTTVVLKGTDKTFEQVAQDRGITLE